MALCHSRLRRLPNLGQLVRVPASLTEAQAASELLLEMVLGLERWQVRLTMTPRRLNHCLRNHCLDFLVTTMYPSRSRVRVPWFSGTRVAIPHNVAAGRVVRDSVFRGHAT